MSGLWTGIMLVCGLTQAIGVIWYLYHDLYSQATFSLLMMKLLFDAVLERVGHDAPRD